MNKLALDANRLCFPCIYYIIFEMFLIFLDYNYIFHIPLDYFFKFIIFGLP